MKIEQDKSLKGLNTFGIEASAQYFTEIRSAEEFDELRAVEGFGGAKKFILGGGSNILLTGDLDGWVVKNAIPGVAVVSETESEVVVKAGAGEVWQDLVDWCIDKNYAGLENLSLIPGLTGAAPLQNIGAYGVEAKDSFEELEAIEISSGARVKFSRADCAFGYRDSIFKRSLKDQFLISSVSFRLTKLSSPQVAYQYRTGYGDVRATLDEMNVQDLSLKGVHDAICRIRRAKLPDPKEVGNAGSFFKNPAISQDQFKTLALEYPKMPYYPQAEDAVKVPAGWLIEQCGWKGKTVGRTGCHKDQALVLVNYGGATGQEIVALARAIQQSVKDRFGIDLSPEVNLL